MLSTLERAGVPFLVGGAYALDRYTGIARFTKDFDIFALPSDRDRILDLLGGAGYRIEIAFSHWLAKAYHDDTFVDLIYGSGNGVAQVALVPPEEMIWSKAFVMERERYDGADIAHLIRAVGGKLDWHRLIDRFGPNWRVLLSHLILFGFIYPGERTRIPGSVIEGLVARLESEVWAPPKDERVTASERARRKPGSTRARAQSFRGPDKPTSWQNARERSACTARRR